jgi:hypothetical protein
MNREDIIRIYKEANGWSPEGYEKTVDELERFAKAVAAHALANIDPSKFMSYQEGFESGKRLAVDEFCKQLRQLHDAYSCASEPSTLRARGEA